MGPPNCSVHSLPVEVAVASVLLLEFGLGLLGNAVALWTFLCRLKVWKPYAVYLFNLVLADLLLTACLPFHIALYLRHRSWGLGPTACRVLLFLLALSRGVGVAFLAAVALDRYLRVVRPGLRVNLLSPRGARAVSGGVWLLMVVLAHQSVLMAPAAGDATECHSPSPVLPLSFSVLWQEVLAFLQFTLPFGLILFCNAGLVRALQKRLRDPEKQPKLRRARVLVTTVVVLFALCFLPSCMARVVMNVTRGTQSCRVLRGVQYSLDVTNSLTYLNSVLNPLVYCFSNPTFRYSYRKAFNTLRGLRQRQVTEPRGSDLQASYS
ncbi:12-(S)-hydroxy-5,8,10,14-eicosatetraenoic acid receptor [Echinops telfairi]|uniref:12-(S)-hydroxy-5,8,10,14-eicosatetraenoic acid receptor n=1 Tax=Echinops telfairi TaxID=9371 RepID=A0ABM0IKL6_ECHTE|nr:12-(S)-hydroxy-5,8,10,14-eicosatetraenoic acid receptor [Echinops telfairi]